RKRNLDFHALFPKVPMGEILVDDYNCAMQKEILMQGRLYISERHICFYSNIFGWVANLVIPFSSVLAIEKRTTAYVIPNAINLVSSKGRFFFSSFLFRDSAYMNLVDTWK
ncbi:GRAM domain-containing protein, partial [Thamnocephalis sphaerospora]